MPDAKEVAADIAYMEGALARARVAVPVDREFVMALERALRNARRLLAQGDA